jgi:ribosomal-protein-alanine N-acetyltransferase
MSATESKVKYPVLETERLRLSLPPSSFAPAMLDFVEENRDHFARWDPTHEADYYTIGFWRGRLDMAREEFRAGRSLRLVITHRDPTQPGVVGEANFNNIIRGVFHACYLGYRIDHRAEGQGLMREALTASLDYVFKEMNLHRVMANYIPHNERSGRLLRRLGFSVEGYARDYLLIAGQWQDHVLTVLSNPNWKL